MRWRSQELDARDPNALPGLEQLSALAAPARTPGFQDLVFHEVLTKTALNQVPAASRMFAGSWTINPYRGCSHACRYCFARATHRYLDFDTGRDFDTQIVVKTNVVQVLHQELRARRGEIPLVMLGSNTDPYQRAEGRYRLMPGIYRELAQARVPFSLLTKGTLVRRDLRQLVRIAQTLPVSVSMSIPIVDERLREQFEPGTPTSRARLATVREATRLGLPVDVFLMPVLPLLTDSRTSLEHTLSDIRAAGARRVLYTALHLRPGVRDWFMRWLGEYHPHLVRAYEGIYGDGAYASKGYRRHLAGVIKPLIRAYGLDGSGPRLDPNTGLNVPDACPPRPVSRRPSARAPRPVSPPSPGQVPTLF
jgi:DNA repair photolyase